jgi:hypothetical protein
VLQQVVKDQECFKYIPDAWTLPKAKICRKFLWMVLATKRPDFASQIVNNANKQRIVERDDDGIKLNIQVNQ